MTGKMMMGTALLLAVAACGGGDRAGTSAAGDDARGSGTAPLARTSAGTDSSAKARVHPNHPSYDVKLHTRTVGDGVTTVDSITVRHRGRVIQTLIPSENLMPAAVGDVDRVSTPDLDGDGHADLAVLTGVAMANSSSHYWLFVPRTGRYQLLGEHETLTPLSGGEWTSFNRGGHGGRMWTAARQRVVDGALVTVATEAQDWLGDVEAYVRIAHELRGGKMVEVRRDTLAKGELTAGPSWNPDR